MKFLPIFSALLVLCVNVFAQNKLSESVNQFLAKPEYKNASVAMKFVDVASGETVFALNENQRMIPASTMKLVSSATALELLGADYRFKTQVAYRGKIDENGLLNGDLILIGGADPALGSEYFAAHYFEFLQHWATAIKQQGIKRVSGKLILDGSVYGSERVPDTWIWGDIGNYYGAGPAAFTVYDNLFRIAFRSPKKVGQLTEIVALSPKIEGMSFRNEVVSADISYDNAYVFGSPMDKNRIIRGSIPRNRKAFRVRAAMPQPEQVLATGFRNALLDAGVAVMGNSAFEKVNQKKIKVVYVQESPTLAEIAKVLNHESVNLFAEHFLNQLAVERYGVGDREKAIKMVYEFWKKHGVATTDVYMEDGSGLSHFNLITPDFFTKLLLKEVKNEAFVHSLPVAGKGTLNRFSKKIFPKNTLQAKSGSMTRIRCYAGYLKTDSGQKLAFSIMANHFSGSHGAIISEIQTILAAAKAK